MLATVAVPNEDDRARDRDRKHQGRPVPVRGERESRDEAEERDDAEEQRQVAAQSRSTVGRSPAGRDVVASIQLPIHPSNPFPQWANGTTERDSFQALADRSDGRLSGDVTRLPARTLFAAAILTCLASASVGGAQPDEPVRVLFVGNSLTATNDLPAQLAALAKAGGHRLETGAVVEDGFSLEDHWNQGDALRAIASGRWDVVILQQGPSSLPESQVHLREWAARYAALARKAGTRPGLLTVWPESTRRSALPAVISSYRNAARAASAELFPAGDAWRRAWACNRKLALYGPDGLHPSRLGTHLAALVVYGRLLKSGLFSPALTPAGISPRTARTLQAAAALALGRKLPAARRCG